MHVRQFRDVVGKSIISVSLISSHFVGMKTIEKTVNYIYTRCYQDEKKSMPEKLIAIVLTFVIIAVPMAFLLGFEQNWSIFNKLRLRIPCVILQVIEGCRKKSFRCSQVWRNSFIIKKTLQFGRIRKAAAFYCLRMLIVQLMHSSNEFVWNWSYFCAAIGQTCSNTSIRNLRILSCH